jgi:hypothetical protein
MLVIGALRRDEFSALLDFSASPLLRWAVPPNRDQNLKSSCPDVPIAKQCSANIFGMCVSRANDNDVLLSTVSKLVCLKETIIYHSDIKQKKIIQLFYVSFTCHNLRSSLRL